VRFRQVNAATVKDVVYNREVATALLIASTHCGNCREFRPYIWTAVDLLEGYPARFYWIEGPKNDIPPGIMPETEFYPKLYVWPAGDGYRTPVLYEGGNSVREIIDFVVANSGMATAPPEINEHIAMELLTRSRETLPKAE
jgi:hypothetical protein